jgi:hypothetical protein
MWWMIHGFFCLYSLDYCAIQEGVVPVAWVAQWKAQVRQGMGSSEDLGARFLASYLLMARCNNEQTSVKEVNGRIRGDACY